MFVLLTLILPTAAESSLYNIIHHYLSTSDKLIFYYPSNRPCPATQNVCDSREMLSCFSTKDRPAVGFISYRRQISSVDNYNARTHSDVCQKKKGKCTFCFRFFPAKKFLLKDNAHITFFFRGIDRLSMCPAPVVYIYPHTYTTSSSS